MAGVKLTHNVCCFVIIHELKLKPSAGDFPSAGWPLSSQIRHLSSDIKKNTTKRHWFKYQLLLIFRSHGSVIRKKYIVFFFFFFYMYTAESSLFHEHLKNDSREEWGWVPHINYSIGSLCLLTDSIIVRFGGRLSWANIPTLKSASPLGGLCSFKCYLYTAKEGKPAPIKAHVLQIFNSNGHLDVICSFWVTDARLRCQNMKMLFTFTRYQGDSKCQSFSNVITKEAWLTSL